MNLSEVMNHEPLFCTSDTRVAEVKYLLKKYNAEELLVVDSVDEKHPVGLIGLEDMTAWSVEHTAIPSDVSALECMRSIPAVVAENSSLEECLNIIRLNHTQRLPVVDMNGHVLGMVEKSELVRVLM